MRATPLVIAVLGLAVVTGCGSGGKSPGAAPPALTSPPASESTSATSPPAQAGGTAKPPAAGGGTEIRSTDWRNVTITGIPAFDDPVFRNGRSSYCEMLPGGAKPAYGHFINEEPANKPSTEDALVLLGCNDSGTPEQVLLPVALDGAKRRAVGRIGADLPRGAGPRPTFTAYSIEASGNVVVTVKLGDGKVETRRYRWAGNGWAKV